ncbi:MAG: hypothetical protein A2Z14_03125 [Chloroflexi bacterium RBG_16_48_8]|nr:MAG: hypothetical protein A2Z14_03125 [Chloroflexi bacterium RBG_16_48_8]
MTLSKKSISMDFRSYLRQVLWYELGLIWLLIMELMWILPWFRAITPVIQARRSLASFFGLLIFFFVVTIANRILRTLGLRTLTHRLILIALLLLGMYSLSSILVYPELRLGFAEIVNRTLTSLQNILELIPEGFIVILMCIYLWWRGLVNSSIGTLEIHTTERKFRLGILALAAFGIVFRGKQVDFLLQAIPIYFASGLLAVTFSRTSSLSRGSTAFRLPYTGRWFIGMALITAITITAGLLTGQLLHSRLAYAIYQFFLESFTKLLTFFEILLFPVVEILVYLAEREIELLSGFIDPDSIQSLFNQMQDQPTPELPIEQGESLFKLPPEAIAAIAVLLLTGLIILLVRRAHQQQRYGLPKIDDVGDTIYKPEKFRTRLKKLLDQFREGIETIQQFGIGRRMITATIIRRIYSLLLDTAADLGQPRHKAETPYEFQQKLSQIFPNQLEEIGTITNAYVQVRYGEIPEEERIITLVEEAWSSIEMEARRLGRKIHA